jgi:hypothetical protein
LQQNNLQPAKPTFNQIRVGYEPTIETAKPKAGRHINPIPEQEPAFAM